MDEIKNTAEVEEQKVVAPESTSAENTTEEAIQTATSTKQQKPLLLLKSPLNLRQRLR